MKKVQRFDTARVKARFDDNGFLIDTPLVARIGLQVYQTATGGERREFRPAAEVFKADSLASYQGKPITLGHKTVNSKNAKGNIVGACAGPGVRDGIGVGVPVVVYDDDSISKAKKKIAAELSVGYSSVDIEESGWGNEVTGDYLLDKDAPGDKSDSAENYPPAPDESGNWVRFDAVQTDIEVNHVAMVFKGRAGIAKLNLDSEQEFPYHSAVSKTNAKGDSKMKTIKIDGVDVEVTPEVAAHVATISAEAQTTAAERDQLKAKVDGFPAQLDAAVNTAVQKAKADAAEHVELVNFAGELGVKTDGLDAKQIKIACIKQASGVDASAKTDAYIDTAFDMVKTSDKLGANRLQVMGGKPANAKDDSADSGITDPQMRFRK
jgi:hypothetical protein